MCVCACARTRPCAKFRISSFLVWIFLQPLYLLPHLQFLLPSVQVLPQPPPDEIFKTWTLPFLKHFLWLLPIYTSKFKLLRAMSKAPVKETLNLAAPPLLHHVPCTTYTKLITVLKCTPGRLSPQVLVLCVLLSSDSSSVTSSANPPWQLQTKYGLFPLYLHVYSTAMALITLLWWGFLFLTSYCNRLPHTQWLFYQVL